MKIYQKPTCSKCRNLLKTLRERKVAFDSINYYATPLTAKELKSILKKLDMKPRDIMRTREAIYAELKIKTTPYTDAELIDILVQNPDLIQRPIVVNGNTASIVRSGGAVEKLFEGR